MTPTTASQAPLTLVLGGTGKTGRRIAARLADLGVPTRIGSRSASPAFDWSDPSSWQACLDGVAAVSINYAPDLAVPGATQAIGDFVAMAKQTGVQRLVILSGRGEAEAQACEQLVLTSGLPATVVRASWFNQNFSEGPFAEMVNAAQLSLPAGEVREPFVDADDIADVVVAALTEPGHAGEIYELTGPRLLSFAEASGEISRATGRPVSYLQVPHQEFVADVASSGAPEEVVWLMGYLFTTVLDGRNAVLGDGVQRALGRAPRDFSAYCREAAAAGSWRVLELV